MKYVSFNRLEGEALLEKSTNRLADKDPERSAAILLTRRQNRGLICFGIVLALALLVNYNFTLIGIIAAITTFYAAAIVYRVMLFKRSMQAEKVEAISDEEARAVPDEELPIYTVLVPAYREPEVIELLLEHLGRIEYPKDRLDLKVLLEADDSETIAAIGAADLGDHAEIVLVPPGDPRTKPKALNFGLSMARGEIVTIYDVEDHPDPLQLRRAVVAFRHLGPKVACLQAKLSYANVGQNLITRWFTLEYAMWFSLFLPGLATMGAPIPLGGTSNHFRRDVLEEMGAWDPHNVTEDADLGIRLHREGYTVRILDSVTLEEANSDFVNWIKQRSRWYKGYLQTWLVHMRHPRQLIREMGWKGFVQFNLFVGGTPVLAVLNPLFWFMTLYWFVGPEHWANAGHTSSHPAFIKDMFPAPVFYLGLVCFAFGNFITAYLTVLTSRLMKRTDLLWAALLVPLYWVMMSIAAIKALIQLISAPTFWEKTTHGLDAAMHRPLKGGNEVGVPT